MFLEPWLQSQLLHRMLESRLTEIDLGKRAPNLDLRDVMHVFRHLDGLVYLVAFDHELLQEVGVSLGINNLPMRIWGFRHDKVIRKGEHALAIFGTVSDEAGIGFRSLERAALMGIGCEAVSCNPDECYQ